MTVFTARIKAAINAHSLFHMCFLVFVPFQWFGGRYFFAVSFCSKKVGIFHTLINYNFASGYSAYIKKIVIVHR